MKTIKYEVSRGTKGYIIATLVVEEQPNFYPVHITAPNMLTWHARKEAVERRYNVLIASE